MKDACIARPITKMSSNRGVSDPFRYARRQEHHNRIDLDSDEYTPPMQTMALMPVAPRAMVIATENGDAFVELCARGLSGAVVDDLRAQIRNLPLVSDIGKRISPYVDSIEIDLSKPKVVEITRTVSEDAKNVVDFGKKTTKKSAGIGKTMVVDTGKIAKTGTGIVGKSLIRAILVGKAPEEIDAIYAQLEDPLEEVARLAINSCPAEVYDRAITGLSAADLQGVTLRKTSGPLSSSQKSDSSDFMASFQRQIEEKLPDLRKELAERRKSIDPEDAEWLEEQGRDELIAAAEVAKGAARRLEKQADAAVIDASINPENPVPVEQAVLEAQIVKGVAKELEKGMDKAVLESQLELVEPPPLPPRDETVPIAPNQLNLPSAPVEIVRPVRTKPLSPAELARRQALADLPADASVADILKTGGVPTELVDASSGAIARALQTTPDVSGAVRAAGGIEGIQKQAVGLFGRLTDTFKKPGAPVEKKQLPADASTLQKIFANLGPLFQKGTETAKKGIAGGGDVVKTILETAIPILTVLMKQLAAVLSSEEIMKLFSGIVGMLAQSLGSAVGQGVGEGVKALVADAPPSTIPHAGRTRTTLANLPAPELIALFYQPTGGSTPDPADVMRILRYVAYLHEKALKGKAIAEILRADKPKVFGQQVACALLCDKTLDPQCVIDALSEMTRCIADEMHRRRIVLPKHVTEHVHACLQMGAKPHAQACDAALAREFTAFLHISEPQMRRMLAGTPTRPGWTTNAVMALLLFVTTALGAYLYGCTHTIHGIVGHSELLQRQLHTHAVLTIQ